MVIRYNEIAKRNEQKIQAILEKVWKITLRHTEPFAPADFYIIENDSIVGAIEIKTRSHKFGKYPTIWMSLRKYISLKNLNLKDIYYVINYPNTVRYIKLDDIDSSKIVTSGRTDRVDAPNDIETLIEIPIYELREI